MANTLAKSNLSKFQTYLLRSINFSYRVIIIILIVLAILFFWTEDLYDYRNWNLSLFLQILFFSGIFIGLGFFYFKPKTSSIIIIISSILFWGWTAFSTQTFWLGWGYLFFPLFGASIYFLNEINRVTNFRNQERKKSKPKSKPK